MKDFIKTEFEKVCMPDDCTERIRQSMERVQPVHRKKLRSLPRVLIAAAVIMCLLVSVTAVGLQKGWLDHFLGNSENVEGVSELQLTAQDEEMEVTLDRMLVDGPFVYLQVSVRTQGDINAAEVFEGDPMLPESSIQQRLYTTYGNGYLALPLSEQGQEMTNMEKLPTQGPVRTWNVTRLDDGSDIHFCSYTMQIILAELPADYEGLNLTLRLDKQRTWIPLSGGGYTTHEESVAIIEEPIVLTDAKARVTTMEDGRQVKVHSLGVQIQGADFEVCDENGDWNSGIMLKDGTKLPFKPGWSAQDYFVEEMQWSICLLNEVIAPDEVAAIYVGDTLYPLNEKKMG